MKILCEVFALFDKRRERRGGTPYIIRGACGLGADKGAAERGQRGGGARAKGWAQICAQREREGRKGEKRACKRKRKERFMREKDERWVEKR